MHPELQAFFDEHEKPAHASKRDVHDHTAKAGRLVANIMKQVLEYKALIMEAEAAPHDPALDSKMEMMHQTFGAIERNAQAVAHHYRELTKDFAQLDRYVPAWRDDIDAYHRAQSATTAPPTEAP
jgi:hypothetical protein